MKKAHRMGSKLAFSAAIALSALVAVVGCGPPSKGMMPSSTGGTTGTGGSVGSGGDSAGTGGVTSSGGVGDGGSTGSGGAGASSSGGSGGSGATGTGGTTPQGGRGGDGSGGATGGAVGSGGAQASGGNGGAGTGTGGSAGKAGSSGGSSGSGGTVGSGGTSGVAGTSGSGGSTSRAAGPCDIYQTANTPCAAAHSTVRALYAAYNGPLYQVRKGSSTKDIPVLADGYVDISVQDSFCSGGTCTISILYDQSPNKNNLVKSPAALWLPNGGDEVNATLASIKINGHTAHGIYVDNSGGSTGVGYRNNATKGLATGDGAEAMYAVFDAKRYNQWCCFDYGNAEASGKDDGNATMEAIYFGNSTQWTRGGGSGPWVAADLENGMFEGDSSNAASNTSIDSSWTYLTAMLKGPSGNAMGLKAGNAQSGTLQTKWNGKRPSGYSPKKLNGAIILGTGGDGSNNAKGTFFEGVITSGNPPDSVDDQIQANIVAAGYGR
jgi:Alpha-L-arabinofuranosidase B, catalytic